MTGNRQTLVDALNAEMLGDIQQMHMQLTSCAARMEALKETQSAMADAAAHMRSTLDDTATQFEIMAKGILMFAQDERKAVHLAQQAEHAIVSQKIFDRVQAVTARLDRRLWLLLGMSVLNSLIAVALLFLKIG